MPRRACSFANNPSLHSKFQFGPATCGHSRLSVGSGPRLQVSRFDRAVIPRMRCGRPLGRSCQDTHCRRTPHRNAIPRIHWSEPDCAALWIPLSTCSSGEQPACACTWKIYTAFCPPGSAVAPGLQCLPASPPLKLCWNPCSRPWEKPDVSFGHTHCSRGSRGSSIADRGMTRNGQLGGDSAAASQGDALRGSRASKEPPCFPVSDADLCLPATRIR